tara:strand:- start:2213 stop:2530 length:318 start_codon:yes stop_codon:yes gene_type:complete
MLKAMYQEYQHLHQNKWNRFIHIAVTLIVPYWIYLSVNNHILFALLGYALSNHALCYGIGHHLENNQRKVLNHAKSMPVSAQTMLFFTVFSPLLRLIDLYQLSKS